MLFKQLRKQVAKTAQQLLSTRLVVNTSGNVSMRVDDKIIITPSGKSYEKLSASDICVVTLDGEYIECKYLPSSEMPLHLAVYNSDSQIKAIVHTHSVHATAVSTLTNELPAIHYQMVDLGGEVPVAPYATFGSTALAKSVMSVLPGKKAALMQNHGSITVASTLDKALTRSITLEWCCEVWLKAISAGEPSLLTASQLEQVKLQMEKISDQRNNLELTHKHDCATH